MTLEDSINNIKKKLSELPLMTEEELKAWADGQLEEAKKLSPVVYYSKDGLHPIERLRIEMMRY